MLQKGPFVNFRFDDDFMLGTGSFVKINFLGHAAFGFWQNY